MEIWELKMGEPEFPGGWVVRSPGCTAMTQEGGEGAGREEENRSLETKWDQVIPKLRY